jgi:hypothetical protein
MRSDRLRAGLISTAVAGSDSPLQAAAPIAAIPTLRIASRRVKEVVFIFQFLRYLWNFHRKVSPIPTIAPEIQLTDRRRADETTSNGCGLWWTPNQHLVPIKKALTPGAAITVLHGLMLQINMRATRINQSPILAAGSCYSILSAS